MKRGTKRITAILLAAVMMMASAACSSGGNQAASTAPSQPAASAAVSQAESVASAAEEPVTIKLFSNLPDRKSGMGLLEETLIQNYKTEHPMSQ